MLSTVGLSSPVMSLDFQLNTMQSEPEPTNTELNSSENTQAQARLNNGDVDFEELYYQFPGSSRMENGQ